MKALELMKTLKMKSCLLSLLIVGLCQPAFGASLRRGGGNLPMPKSVTVNNINITIKQEEQKKKSTWLHPGSFAPIQYAKPQSSYVAPKVPPLTVENPFFKKKMEPVAPTPVVKPLVIENPFVKAEQ